MLLATADVQDKYSNAYFSVDPEDGAPVVDLTFVSEPLGLPAAEGYGWAQLEFGDKLGQDERYTITRKLGWGMHSSTWLAHDKIESKFVAVKALTGHITEMYNRGVVWEADALRLIASSPVSPHCIRLLDEFTIAGKGTAGSHMCFVMPLYGGDVKALQNARPTQFPLPLAKRISLHLLRGLAHAHGRGIVHTDLKHDNIVFSTALTTADVEAWLARDPSRRHPQEISYDGPVSVAVSQPLSAIYEEDALQATYLLADFGSALPSNPYNHRTITAVQLRAPEVYLGANWDKPADMWAFVVLVFEFVTGKSLFVYKPNTQCDLTEDENILQQMIVYSGTDFRPEQLRASSKADDFFDLATSKLKKSPAVNIPSLTDRLVEHRVVCDQEAAAVADFIKRCLQLEPSDRASAAELLKDPWFEGVE